MVHNLKPCRQFEQSRVRVSKKHICRRERLLSVSRVRRTDARRGSLDSTGSLG